MLILFLNIKLNFEF